MKSLTILVFFFEREYFCQFLQETKHFIYAPNKRYLQKLDLLWCSYNNFSIQNYVLYLWGAFFGAVLYGCETG